MRTKNIAMILTLALTAGLCQTAAPSQAATPKLSTKKLTMKVGKTAALKVKKTSKKSQMVDCVRKEKHSSYGKEKDECKSKSSKSRQGKNFL